MHAYIHSMYKTNDVNSIKNKHAYIYKIHTYINAYIHSMYKTNNANSINSMSTPLTPEDTSPSLKPYGLLDSAPENILLVL